MSRGLRALEPHLPKPASLLEIRATSSTLELQLIADQAVTSLRYRELPTATGSQFASPTGIIDPPVQVPVYGSGNLTDNSFPPSEVDLLVIARAFPVAVKAVDPTDGWVSELIVRRFLPFGTAVRARIYVESPRMRGSIDTSSRGIPLGGLKL